jgi:hypothetical protein
MSNSRVLNSSFRQVTSRLIFLAVLLPSVNAFAETTAPSANETIQANQAAEPYQPVQRKYSTTQKSENHSSHRVFKDDYARLMVRVHKAGPPKIIWLKETQEKPRKAQTEQNWLARKGRSE